MPIIASAFLPPSPLLIPEIGGNNQPLLKKTEQAYLSFAKLLQEEEAEIIIIISSTGQGQAKNISANINPELRANLQDFGYLAHFGTFLPALKLADEIKETLRREEDIRLIAEQKLDHGVAVPLKMLSSNLKNPKILPLHPALEQDNNYHFLVGQKLGLILNHRPEKIAVIASGYLSQKLKKNSPAGYSPKGARFDNRLMEYLMEKEGVAAKILSIDEKNASEAMEDGLKQLALLLGMIGENFQTRLLAYQNDFGVGYLSANFDLRVAQI